jgi:retron-type reverse transcriptase
MESLYLLSETSDSLGDRLGELASMLLAVSTLILVLITWINKKSGNLTTPPKLDTSKNTNSNRNTTSPSYSSQPKVRTNRSIPRPHNTDPQLLAKHGIPIIREPKDLALRMGLSAKQLYWLTSHASSLSYREYHGNYIRFWIPKKSGKSREINAPLPHLKKAQHWILSEILQQAPAHPASHGFIKNRSTATNAEPHCNQQVVVKLDLINFFPTITFRRVRGVFCALGYSRKVAYNFAMLTTFAPQEFSRAALPQGAPTSPAISNLVCRRLDARLAGLAKQFGATYTRYADDLTFSGPVEFQHRLSRFFLLVNKIIKREGFQINWEKRRILRKGQSQQICGLVVNQQVNLPRKQRRLFRSMLHRLEQGKPLEVEGKSPEEARAWLRGQLAYWNSTGNPLARELLSQLDN